MTIYPQVRLVDPSLPTFIVDHVHGVVGQGLDLGDAETRAQSEPAPSADGTIDTTAYLGARTVTLAVTLTDDADLWALEQQLRIYTRPRLRPWLYFTQTPTSPEQRIQLRRSQFSSPIGSAPRGRIDRETQRIVTCQWVAPSGIVEGALERTLEINAGGSSSPAEGLVFPAVFPLDFGTAPVAGRAELTQAGTADAYPTLRVNGPCGGTGEDIIITSETAGAELKFTDLEILAGEYLEIDMRRKTALYMGDPSDSRIGWLDFATSAWWVLTPGVNTLTFTPTASAPPSSLEVTWHDAYL